MLTITQGDNKLLSPYTGADPMEITLSEATPGTWWELIAITGTKTTATNGFEILSQHWGGTANDPSTGWRQADSNGIAKFLFNASLQDDIVERSHQYGWLIPPGIYQFLVREFYNIEPLQSIDVEIVSEASASIAAATANKRKGGGKK